MVSPRRQSSSTNPAERSKGSNSATPKASTRSNLRPSRSAILASKPGSDRSACRKASSGSPCCGSPWLIPNTASASSSRAARSQAPSPQPTSITVSGWLKPKRFRSTARAERRRGPSSTKSVSASVTMPSAGDADPILHHAGAVCQFSPVVKRDLLATRAWDNAPACHASHPPRRRAKNRRDLR